jgi:hypothetical protein
MKIYKASVLYSAWDFGDGEFRAKWEGTISASDKRQAETLAVQAAAEQADPCRLTRWSVVLKEHKVVRRGKA